MIFCKIFISYQIGRIRFVDLGFVVVGYNGFDVPHAAIAQFKRVPVENFVKWV